MMMVVMMINDERKNNRISLHDGCNTAQEHLLLLFPVLTFIPFLALLPILRPDRSKLTKKRQEEDENEGVEAKREDAPGV